ncbi:hypothetical protein CROQUDRAFT_97461 [Cronartium quercuum f. sp. fusiforme G11]|uniref:UDENN domain-containing protein n=1 Tax=Cronartium quercuum f. sp. fusiforme G11 TaxID=708437 RepID=A0A9P6T9G7_9BASI|nr:hypothetical protein CROQUDRAFT_97461 [Cronartium quercuum f. sp. fusiforme G11]
MASTDQEFDLGQPSYSAYSEPQTTSISTSTCHRHIRQSPSTPAIFEYTSPPSPTLPSSRRSLASRPPPSITFNRSANQAVSQIPSNMTISTQTCTRLPPLQPSKINVISQPAASLTKQTALTSPLKQTMPIPTASLPDDVLAASRRWFYTFALINFDLDEGPDFDNCYPPSNFTSAQSSNIAFSSFPDCAKTGSLMFTWRIPAFNHTTPHPVSAIATTAVTSVDPKSFLAVPATHSSPSDPAPTQGPPPSNANFDLHGYVYFVQERDPSVPRGYNQKSLVLITHLSDYAGLFSTLLSRLGPLYSAQGPTLLEAAVHNMARWPDPAPGTSPELPFLGQVYTFAIPLPNQAQLLERRSQTKSCLHGEILASPPLTYLSSILFGSQGHLSISSIWLLWEILILGEPLVVYGSSPDIVSEAVIHLRNLIRPIPFQGDWRPYITIHDPDFPNLFNKSKARTGALIGATNPIILSNTHYWPHVLSLSSKQGTTFGLTTERKRHLHKDKSLVKQLEACLERKDYHHADVLLSRHFALLTEQFLQPLQRYFATLLPHDKSLSQPQRPSSFNEDVFLKSLKAHATLLEFRFKIATGLSNSIPAFYTKFLRSPNFGTWLHSQIDYAAAVVRARYLDRLQSPIELDTWAQGKSQEQIKELLHRIETEMSLVTATPINTSLSPLTSPFKPTIELSNNPSSDLSNPSSPTSNLNSPASSGPSESASLQIERLRAQADRLRNIFQSS